MLSCHQCALDAAWQDKRPNCFRLHSTAKKETYMLAADTAEERLRWLGLLTEAISPSSKE